MKCSECGEEIIDEECLCTNPDDSAPIIDEGELLEDYVGEAPTGDEDWYNQDEPDDF